MRCHMRDFVSRRRYELVALAIALVCAGLHFWSDSQPDLPVTEEEQSRAALSATLLRGIHLLENRATDVKFRARGPRQPHADVVVVAIDERSAQKYGLWPWSRVRIAEAIENLGKAGAKAIGLDLAFIDETKDSQSVAYREMLDAFDQSVSAQAGAATQLASFRSLLEQKGRASPDERLAAALQATPQVVLGTFAYQPRDLNDFSEATRREHAEVLEPHLLRKIPGRAPGSFHDVPFDALRSWRAVSAQTPLRRFADTGVRLGHCDMVPDADGALRRSPIFAKLTGPKGLLPSLALQTAATYYGVAPEPAYEEGLFLGARLRPPGGEPILVPYQNNEPFTLINYDGHASVFPTVSIADVIENTFDPALVKGKAVLVGVTLTGSSGDQRVTPFQELTPGIYTHAALVSNILSNEFLSRPAGLVLLECLVMIALALALARLIPRLRRFSYKALAMAGVLVAYLAADLLLFSSGVQLASVLPTVNVIVVSFGVVFFGYLSVDREKLQLRATFSKYLGEDVMEEALKHPEKLNQGEKREMTVLFSDIRGFTTLSERMVPEKLAAFIKEYLSPMTQIVFDEKGTLDKYIGDALMAFWNAPLDQPDHALRACRASIGFLQKLEELKAKWRAESYPEFDIGVGINTGPMIVGNMGSDVRVDYTVMGDAVNLASRLEGTNKEYETRIIISETTWQQVQGKVAARRLGAVRVKGKRKPVRIYELRGIGLPEGVEAEAIAAFEAGLEAYTEQRFVEAEGHFRRALALWPEDAPCRRYLEEIEVLKVQPPGPGWDGVYTATTK